MPAKGANKVEHWGVFGGSFNPPHIGHLLLVNYLLGLGLVDRVLVLPCYAHAFGKDLCSFQLRCAWLHSMFERDSRVVVSGIEASLAQSLGHAPRSLEVLEHLESAYPERRFRWVMGQDILDSGETAKWYRWEELQARFDPLVIPRSKPGLAGPLPQISSSEIRIAWSDASKRSWLDARLPLAVRSTRQAHPDSSWPCQGPAEPVQEAWVVGQGKAGRSMLEWLREQGIAAHGISARRLLQQGSLELPHTLGPPDLVWMATRPDQSARALKELAPRLQGAGDSTMICSGAGAYSAAGLGLAPNCPVGSLLGTLHPITSLTGEASPLHHSYFGWSGPEAMGKRLRAWLGEGRLLDLNGLDDEGRLGYHAACALSSNYWGGVHTSAQGMLERLGIGTPRSRFAMMELMRQSLQNLMASGIPEGVSGPLVRGQDEQVRAHQAQWSEDDAALHAALVQALRNSLQPAE